MTDRSGKKGKKLLWVTIPVLLSVLIFAVAHTCFSTPPKERSESAQSELALLVEAWNTIQQVYVDRSALKPRTLFHGAIAGMVDALGDAGHSTFLTKKMITQEKEFTQGRYMGVGMELRMLKGHVVIVAPLDGSPAKKAGLRSGEVITKVDGKNLVGLDIGDVVELILGQEGTRVTLTVFDPKTDDSRDVTLTRAAITVNNVNWRRLPGTTLAHLRIAALSDGVSGTLHKALAQLGKEQITGIVLDLRDDPGGLLDEAVRCSSQFLESGDVLLEKDAAGKIAKVPVRHDVAPTRLPVVVLINEGTASAAEIIAGAIKDAGRGKLVGKQTFGTGTVLQQFNLSDGSALLLAVQEWLTPKGHSIWHKGIAPDLAVTLPEGVTPLLPDEEEGLDRAKLWARRDTQLLAAIKMLSHPSR